MRSQKRRYKRYTKSPLRYGGGKSLAVGFILEHMPTVKILAARFH
ncbi:DNA adenine methylase [Helicobacter ailurogastricus]|uniref:DNA adenine methylase n=1 Tax=Helicobacter ailurogastricus TaxID=1578720 RepID=A0A0K2X587_9HELI|nr:DNA adenine methylase [Helicobacter ailurogastricus]CRF42750.1 DNA adenine methylase [Helicobacter ailurogastricus]CRF43908.1 DNA adenine methylase [Helicobacter ailurogastricus]